MQTAEGALNEVHSILQRVRELRVQFDNGTLEPADRAAIGAEVTQLSAEVGRIATRPSSTASTCSSGIQATITFQVGANDGRDDHATGRRRRRRGHRPRSSSPCGANDAGIIALDVAHRPRLEAPAAARADLGAIQNRLEHTINNLACTRRT